MFSGLLRLIYSTISTKLRRTFIFVLVMSGLFQSTTLFSQCPQAFDDQDSTGYSSFCSIVIDVQGNDQNTDTVNLSTFLIQAPSAGTATLLNFDSVQYTPGGILQNGFDTIVYSVCNSCGCDTAMAIVYLSTYSCNVQPPVAQSLSVFSCWTDSIIIPVAANDFDPDGGPVFLNTITQASVNGGVAIIDALNVKYLPVVGFEGIDSFEYSIVDAGQPNLTSTAWVYVQIDSCNYPPTVVDDNGVPIDTMFITMDEDGDTSICFTVIPDSLNQIFTTSVQGVQNGVYAIVNDTCFSYIPDNDFAGREVIEVHFCVNNGAACTIVYLIIDVIDLNDPPVAVDDIVAMNWTGNLVINAKANDFDPDGDPFSITQLITNTAAGVPTINNQNNIRYEPDEHYAGVDSFDYVICDINGLCDTGRVFVSIPINARDDAISTDKNDDVIIPVLSNDAVTDNLQMVICRFPEFGGVGIEVDQTITYGPTTNFTGTDDFCYLICNGNQCDSAKVVILVGGAADQLFVPEGISPNGDLINDFFEIDGILNFPDSDLQIFNRWGQKVWDGFGPYENDFNGQDDSGDSLPDGVYFYILNLNSDGSDSRSGSFTIYR